MKFLAFALVGISVSTVPMPAMASGSGSGGYSGGGRYAVPDVPRDPYAVAYSRGKSQFKKRIACKTCEYSQGVNDSVTATKIASRVKAGEFGLTKAQQVDVMVFLMRRYRVSA